jgi:hypothetical protein
MHVISPLMKYRDGTALGRTHMSRRLRLYKHLAYMTMAAREAIAINTMQLALSRQGEPGARGHARFYTPGHRVRSHETPVLVSMHHYMRCIETQTQLASSDQKYNTRPIPYAFLLETTGRLMCGCSAVKVKTTDNPRGIDARRSSCRPPETDAATTALHLQQEDQPLSIIL